MKSKAEKRRAVPNQVQDPLFSKEAKAFAEFLSENMEKMSAELSSMVRRIPDYARFDEAKNLELSREDLRLMIGCLQSGSPDPYMGFVTLRARQRLQEGFALDSLIQALDALETVIANNVNSLVIARFYWKVFSGGRDVLSREIERALRDYASRQELIDILVKERTAQLAIFRSLAENTVDAIVMSDLKGRISYANRAAYDLLRGDYENQSLLGRVFADLWPPTSLLAENPVQYALSSTNREWRGELKHKRVDATAFDAAVTMFAVDDDHGEVIAVAAIIRDVTEQKKLENLVQESLQRRGFQVQVSTQVAQQIATAEAIDVLFERVVTLIKERFGYYHTQILRYEPALDAVVLVAGFGDAGKQMLELGHKLPMGKGLIGRAAATGETVLRPSLSDDPDWLPNPLLAETRGEIAVPIKLGEQILGVLDVQSNQAGALGTEDQLLLEGLCGQIAVAIESTRLRQQMQERMLELSALYQSTSHEGWKTIRQSTALASGYLYDRLDVHQIDVDNGVPQPLENLESNLVIYGQSIGRLGVQTDPQIPLSEDDIKLIEEVSDQVAQALETSRLFQQTQMALSEAQALYDGSALISQAKSFDKLLQALADTTALGRMDQIVLEFFDRPWETQPPDQMINAAILDRSGTARESVGATYHLKDFPYLLQYLHHDEPVISSDVLTDDRLDESTLQVAKDLGIRSMVFWPLVAADQWFGAIAGQSGHILSMTQEDIRLIGTLVEQVASAIQSVRLSQDMQSRLNELNTLQRLMSREAWAAYQSRTVGETQGYLYNQVEVRELSAGAVAFEGGRFVGTQVDRNVREQSIPLTVRGERIGVLGVQPQDLLSLEEEAFLEAIAEQVAQAMERARLMEQTQKSAAELQTVAEVSTATSTILDPIQLLQAVVDLTGRNFGLYHAQVYLLDDMGRNLNLSVGTGEVGQSMVREGWCIQVEDAQSLVARVARRQHGEYIADTLRQPDVLQNPLLPNTRSELAVPMIVGDRLLGVFDVQSDIAGHFGDDDVRTFATLASQTSVALQNAQLYAEQLATVERLRELDNMKSAFLANMSHELRTPLNSILGFTQVILEGLDGDLTDLMISDLELIEKNGKHLLNLINDVLDMAKIEAGRLNLSPEPINLYDLLDDVILSSSSLARDKNLYANLNADPAGDWVVMADHVRLRQVFINLMSNSVKFTEMGGITFELERMQPATANEVERIQVRVKDTGMGIPPHKLEEIFEAFSQVDTSTTRKVSGTGLGLPISRRLIELHGGRLWAFSKGIPGEGSIFYLELPVAK